jgi:hypothetical protein
MSWENEFSALCAENKIEAAIEGSEYLLVVPKMPSQEIQDKLRAIVPSEIQYRYVEGPKLATTLALRIMFKQMKVSCTVEMNGHAMTFTIEGDSPAFTEENSPLLDALKIILEADTFVEDWKIILNGETIYDSTLTKMLAMQIRPERDIGFTKDDILNLRIALECQDVNDFINSL